MNPSLPARRNARPWLAAVFGGAISVAAPKLSLAAVLVASTHDVSDLSGTVYDQDGHTVAGAEVRAIDANGHVVSSATTDRQGSYAINNLPPGHYGLRALHNGNPIGQTDIDALPGSSLEAPIGSAARELNAVMVSAQRFERARNALSPSTGSSQYVFDQKAIEALPRGDHTPLNEVLLQAPGVVNDSYGQLHIRGDHADLQYRINGIVLPEGVSTFGETLDTRVAQKIDLLTGALPAQYGYRTAGVVDITTRQHLDGGMVDLYGGSHDTLNPGFALGDTIGRFTGFVTGSFFRSNLGIEPPTNASSPIHDATTQGKGFGYASWLLGDNLKLTGMFGSAVNRFEIPNNPGQSPVQDYLTAAGVSGFDSTALNSRQFENTDYGLLALQGIVGNDIDYQFAVFNRVSSVKYEPDQTGELVFDGDASSIKRKSSTLGMQGDVKIPLGDQHTLRTGLSASTEDDRADNTSTVFPQEQHDANGSCPPSGQAPGDSGYCLSGGPTTIVDNNPKNGNTLFGVYAQDQWDLSSSLTINYGLRYDHLAAYVDAEQVSPRLGLIWYASKQTTLHAAYARYFTPPANELVSTPSLAKFLYTTNSAPLPALPDAPTTPPNSPVKPERDHYFDIGLSQQFTPHFNVGLDTFYKYARDLLDEGQFGSALIFTPFNYQRGHVYGFELSSSYHEGNLSAWGNVTHTIAQATNVESGQFNFGPDDLAYISQHYIYLDHDQHWTASGGVSYLWLGTTYGTDFTYGGGLRNDGDGSIPNGGKQPSNLQMDLSAMHPFHLGSLGELDLRGVVVNLLDRSNQIHDGSGIGVGAPQYGPRRALYVGITKPFSL